MEELVLEARNLRKSFGDTLILDGIDLLVYKRDVICLLGPSGAGKTSLLRCLNHLEAPSSGAVFMRGELIGYERRGSHLLELSDRQIARQRRSIGMVFQSFNLFGHLSVLENIIEAPIGVLGRAREEAKREAMALLAGMGLSGKASAMPAELSGGQQQRVAIARALAMNPEIMLFDEPTSALDPELVSGVLEAIRTLAEQGMTMVIVTHEIGFARQVATRAVFMDQGRIIEQGSPESVLGDSQHQRTRDFLSKVI